MIYLSQKICDKYEPQTNKVIQLDNLLHRLVNFLIKLVILKILKF